MRFDADETCRQLDKSRPGKVGGLDSLMTQVRHLQLKDSGSEDKASIAKIFEQVGLQKILSLLEAEDNDVRIHAVKVVANLAAEGDFISLPRSSSMPCYCLVHHIFNIISCRHRGTVLVVLCYSYELASDETLTKEIFLVGWLYRFNL